MEDFTIVTQPGKPGIDRTVEWLECLPTAYGMRHHDSQATRVVVSEIHGLRSRVTSLQHLLRDCLDHLDSLPDTDPGLARRISEALDPPPKVR